MAHLDVSLPRTLGLLLGAYVLTRPAVHLRSAMLIEPTESESLEEVDR